jgi:tRNA pseudouridine55 synthase
MASETTDGVLLADKPAGMTSHDVVAVARRSLRTRRIGHTGTLDPFATGLLVLLVGRATRLLPYVHGEPKVYDATIRFGVETDSCDLTGAVAREAPLPSREAVEAAIPQLTGTIDQRPPAHSAKKVAGERAYTAARRGEPLELPLVPVTVHDWALGEWRGDELDVRITCGGGTYIRALARDLGVLAGSAAHLTRLRRVRSGHFDVRDAVTIDALREAAPALLPMRAAIPHLPVASLDDAAIEHVLHGRAIPAVGEGSVGALADGAGELVAIAERQRDWWQPRLVLRDR